jgi:hypothetical protein
MIYDAAQMIIEQIRALGIPAHLADYSEGRIEDGKLVDPRWTATISTAAGEVHVKDWMRKRLMPRRGPCLSRFDDRPYYNEDPQVTIDHVVRTYHRRAYRRCPRVKAMRRDRHARIVASAHDLIGQLVEVPEHERRALPGQANAYEEDDAHTIVPGVRIYPSHRPCVVRITGIKSRQYDVIHMDFEVFAL